LRSKDHFVDAVIVPLVVGRHLIDPLGLSVVRIAREDGHRPLVVARTLLGIPGRGVARTVIDEVQTGVIRQPAPCAAATDLPLVALPGLGARVLADRLAVLGRLVRVEQDLIVRPFGEGAPYLLAALEVVGRDVALHAKLTAGNADQDLVLDDERRGGARTAFARIAILDAPRHLPGLGIERDQGGVGLMQEDLAVAIGDAAIDGVAAHHRNDVRILLGLVLPDDLVLLRKVKSVDLVRERRMDVHHVADDERPTFVAAQHAGREGPGDLELADIGCGDLIQLRIACVGVVTGRHHPVFWVLRHLVQLFIGIGCAYGERRHGAETGSG
jgi:hypothetical protein